jgi:hypothetical protein
MKDYSGSIECYTVGSSNTQDFSNFINKKIVALNRDGFEIVDIQFQTMNGYTGAYFSALIIYRAQ